MGTMNISLPDSLKAFIDRRVAEAHYGTASEYLRELVRRDEARLHLRALLEEGLRSPVAATVNRNFWASKRRPRRSSGR